MLGHCLAGLPVGQQHLQLLLQVAPLGIVVIGQAFVILLRGLDLSVASVMATVGGLATGFSGHERRRAVDHLRSRRRSASPPASSMAGW